MNNEQKIEEKKFMLARPRKWKNKTSGKLFKVVPWFQPMDDESRFDFRGLVQECIPELKNDVLREWECYSGLLLQMGWLIENSNGCWLGILPVAVREEFEELGWWQEGDTYEQTIK